MQSFMRFRVAPARVALRPLASLIRSSEARPPAALHRQSDGSTRSITYKVTVRTGDYRGAGTNANVKLQLFGSRGKSPSITLDEECLVSSDTNSSSTQNWKGMETSGDRPGIFDRNSHQVFEIDVPRELGDIQSVQIGHDNEGLGSGWYLENVLVESEVLPLDGYDSVPNTVDFICGKWIGDVDSGSGGVSGPLERVLLRKENLGGSSSFEPEVSRFALVAGGPGLKICTSGVAVPHADKVRRGERGVNRRNLGHAGDDAYFIAGEKAVGLADGVGQWRDKGIDSGEFSRSLMSTCLKYAESSYGRQSASALLASSASDVSQSGKEGSSTACILTLDQATGVASVANLGDSGVLIGRWSNKKGKPRVVFRSPQQEHEFGYPFQLGHHEHADHPARAQLFSVVLEAGDIIILGTDGLFDNVSDADILEDVFKHVEQPGDAKKKSIEVGSFGSRKSNELRLLSLKMASGLAELAFSKSVDKRCDTPFSRSASEAFDIIYRGGKKDDITVLVAYVAPK